ncbi:DUF87 domain-containing protein [Candidatus Berkelbacteria bacterium]|nr:DUF87 domain-containing protein [Candidatus Berkelbacteria bacterium]
MAKQTIQETKLEKELHAGETTLLDIISPAAFTITPNYLELNNLYVKTFFVFTYPRYLNTNWLSPVINFDIPMDISMFIYPVETREVMGQLRRRQTQLESSVAIQHEKGQVRDPELETAVGDIDALREVLQKGETRIFHFSLYITVYATSMGELDSLNKQLESAFGGMLIYTKQAFLQMEQGFNSSLPLGADELQVLRNLDTASLSTTFPFTSATLSSNRGILYGINRHNNSLILFDRFDLENANSIVFARSGAGKSYMVKLEALRYLMLGTDVIIIDPENEYRALAEAVGGSFMNLSLNSTQRINPFDLPPLTEGETGENVLRSTIAMIEGLISLMVGGLTPDESGILDKALYEVYALKDITADPASHKNPPPLLPDLISVLANMTGAESLVKRLQKFTEGTFAGLFTKPTNFELTSGLVVFSIRDLEEQLRPIGMYLILSYIWGKIRRELRRRLVIMDEAWVMMAHEDSAKFVHALVKRARKYYLGMTVITQDAEDFLDSKYGRAVLNNAAMQVLLKQSTAAIDKIAEVFNLTEGEKFLLLEADVGEGLFFAGKNHVAIKVVASYIEDQLITTDPRQLLAIEQATKQPKSEPNQP